jgi:hypothetical protein
MRDFLTSASSFAGVPQDLLPEQGEVFQESQFIALRDELYMNLKKKIFKIVK